MKIFVSWSGELSKQIAQTLRTWLPRLIQSLEVFYSPEDIEKGDNWDTKISQELSTCNYGIICLTSENTTAPWVHFEAGALARALESRVSTLLVNIKPSDIKGPLSRYQATRMEKDDFFQLIESINKTLESPLENTVLEPLFDALWPTISSEFGEVMKQFPGKPAQDKEKDASNAPIEEILQLLRKQNALLANPEELLPPAYFEHLQRNVLNGTRRPESILPNLLRYLSRLVDRLDSFSHEMDIRIFDAINFEEIFVLIESYISQSIPTRTFEKYYMQLRELHDHYIFIIRHNMESLPATER